MSHPTSQIDRQQRAQRNGHEAAVLWLTGLSAAGKSTLAYGLEAALHQRGAQAFVLDGDNLRHGLNRDLGFSPEDRAENIRRVGHVARLMMDSGQLVICSFISPYRDDRARVAALMGAGRFVEIFVDCPLDVCEQRDPKGLYKRARSGALPQFTGVSAPYEPPDAPDLHLRTDQTSPAECIAQMLALLQRRDLLRQDNPGSPELPPSPHLR